MNYYGKSPLEMTCPNCGNYGAHPVVRTEPRQYHWSDSTVDLFTRIVGRDIAFRRRIKKCTRCDRQFTTVEMANTFLRGLIIEVQRLETQLAAAQEALVIMKQQNTEREAERKATFSVIRKVSKLLNSRLPERARRSVNCSP